jgi:pimeloyl-ACP methyl ester carboxylesterase
MSKRSFIQTPELRLAYTEFSESGPGILLLHGLYGRGSTWKSTADWLAPYGRVVALDQRGHGWSDKPDQRYARQDFVEDAAQTIQQLGIGPALVIGHSMGGLNAINLAARYPELVRGIVVEDMTVQTRRGQAHHNLRREWLESWPLPFHSLAEVHAFFEADGAGEGEYFIEVMREEADGYRPMYSLEHMLQIAAGWDFQDFWDDLEQVQCPALILKGELSGASRDELQEMARRAPQGRFVEVAQANHVVHYSQPQAWREAVEPFVKELLVVAA